MRWLRLTAMVVLATVVWAQSGPLAVVDVALQVPAGLWDLAAQAPLAVSLVLLVIVTLLYNSVNKLNKELSKISDEIEMVGEFSRKSISAIWGIVMVLRNKQVL